MQALIGPYVFPQKFSMEEIVIAGISGRLPESNNLEEFWENLINGVDMVTEDDRRWKPGKRVPILDANCHRSEVQFWAA